MSTNPLSFSSKQPAPQWLTPTGEKLACEEKEKLLNENLAEIQALCQDAFEDALLMGCSEDCFKNIFKHMIHTLEKEF